jgi:hypothetical protein
MRPLAAVCLLAALTSPSFADEMKFLSHPPMRPLPTPQTFALATGPKFYVDPARGKDSNNGSEAAPWKSLVHSVRQLKPGDTLYLRGGIYYEKVSLSRSGTAEAPITIAGHPGELPILDGGLREFHDNPQACWMPNPNGVEGEFISTAGYLHLDDRQVPHQFVPSAWEPMWGIEDDRPLALGFFADSMVPLHGYRSITDLRSTNEFGLDKKELQKQGIYCGPGIWFNRETGRIHIRLAPTKLPGLGDNAYRGETDPRKLRLSIAVGFGQDVLRINGVKHVRIQNLILRGATGSPLIHIYGSENITLDHLTIFGGFPALLVNASKDIRVANCAFRSNAAPWHSRGHMKYRGTASYVIVVQDNQPRNETIDIGYCEFTDGHDFAYLRFVKNLRFHHNHVDNFNDDGLEIGPKLRDHTIFIEQNRIGGCLLPLTEHLIDKDESPLDHDAKAGIFISRNVFDLRAGSYYQWPTQPDPSGSYLHYEGHLLGGHGGPVAPVMRFYHNTVVRRTPVFRDYFLMGLGAMAMRNTERDVFNNIFVQTDKVPGVGFAGVKEAGNLREGGNILWGLKDGPKLKGDPFAKFRATAMFKASQKWHGPGWTTLDRVADPLFAHLEPDGWGPADLTLRPGSPAIDAGQVLPKEWPDALRDVDKGPPDIGAFPVGVEPWGVGVDGRLSVLGGSLTGKQNQ